MRCLPSCGWQEKPESTRNLIKHVESCQYCVPADRLIVIWKKKDHEFVVVEKVTKKDHVIEEIVFKTYPPARKPEPIEILPPIEVLVQSIDLNS